MTDEIIATLKTQLEKERNYISVLEHQWNLDRDYIQLVMELVTELKQLRLDPITYDYDDDTDAVVSFKAGYNAALGDVRDIIHKYFPKET